MRATMDLCISCKGCRRECPTGVDMARMKIEFLHHYRRRHGLSARDRLIAFLPRYAPYAARLAPLLNLRNRSPLLARLGERYLGLSAARNLPKWSSRPYRGSSPHPTPGTPGLAGGRPGAPPQAGEGIVAHARSSVPLDPPPPAGEGRVGAREVVLLVDTFNRYFEPENAYAAERVLARAGYRAVSPDPERGRPLCCGRTFLAAGLVDEARREARRMLDALAPHVRAGRPIVGLEPSCLLTLRDEFPVLLPGVETKALADRARLFEELVAAERAQGRFDLPVRPMPGRTALLHGHCHQKAFATVGAAVETLRLIPELDVKTFDSTCCGMAGAFGYEAEHHDMSLRIGELGVLPRLRAAPPDTMLAACGASCRHQIADALGRDARHIVRLLDDASAPRA
jgi:Fe-S oxidoreductase